MLCAGSGLLTEGGKHALPRAMAPVRSSTAVQVSRSTSVALLGAFAAADFQADLPSLAAVLSQPGAGLSVEVWHRER